MDRIIRSHLIRKAFALVLALVVGLTFVPLLGSNAYAADDQPKDIFDAFTDLTEDDDAEEIDVSFDGSSPGKTHAIDITEPKIPKDESAADTVETDDTGRVSIDMVSPDVLERIAGSDAKLADISSYNEMYTMSVSRSGSVLTVNAALKYPYTRNGCLGGIYIDDVKVVSFNNYTTTSISNYRINLSSSQLTPGYHSVDVTAYVASTGEYVGDFRRTYRADITATPNYSGVFEVYSNYLVYAPYSSLWSNSAYDLYLEYSPDGKNWARSGYMRCNAIQLASQQQYQISGLIPNHYYATRIRYGKVINGQLFLGPVRGTGTYKTGPAKAPKIKSITCKAVKVKRHKVKHYGYYTGVYLYTEKFYTYKVKITVKLKKKPGTAGLWINGKFCKGNKKKYTATFTPYPNYSAKKPKGRKWGVVIASYQNKSYGGYSPLIQKKKKLK